jgi:hypothetical protein
MASYLKRRGFDLGAWDLHDTESIDQIDNWKLGKPILLSSACSSSVAEYQSELAQSYSLYSSVLNEEECEEVLHELPYLPRLNQHFESLGCSMNEGDDQEIETILFDAIDPKTGGIIAEDLWMKVSWLSFHDEDASLRFRFSFGVDLHEDVALDKSRQHYSSLLTEAVFPESKIITQHLELKKQLQDTLEADEVHFVERIVYFNAPNGGAYLHHDRERGHAGVVYAQLSGSTFWLALPKASLIDEIVTFTEQAQTNNCWPQSVDSAMQTELMGLSKDLESLSNELESFSNSTLIHLINETEIFVQQLITNGHCRTVNAGDVLLLPQETELSCCWHSVFTLGEKTGQSVSFAIRTAN